MGERAALAERGGQAPGPAAERQPLVRILAETVRALLQQAEAGATAGEIAAAATRAGRDCARFAADLADEGGGHADIAPILHRLLRKEARRRWERSGEHDRTGDGAAALWQRRVSALLDTAADALVPPAAPRPAYSDGSLSPFARAQAIASS